MSSVRIERLSESRAKLVAEFGCKFSGVAELSGFRLHAV